MGHTVKEPHRVRLNLTMRKEAEAQGVEWSTPGPICTEGPASVSCLPLPPGLVQWQCPAPTDFSLSFINISHAWLRCFSSPPTATITLQSRADLPPPLLRIEELRDFHVFVNLKTEINWRGQTKKKKKVTILAALSAKANTECPAELRWIQYRRYFFLLLVNDPQEKEIN